MVEGGSKRFVDPRTVTEPEADGAPARTTRDPTELERLHVLCREARLYDVEAWIREGHPLQLAPGTPVRGRRHRTTALGIALDREDHALVHLLLCNGYNPNFEEGSPLDAALRARREDLFDRLLEWGADPHRVSRTALFETYRSDWMERFRAFGIDLTDGHELADVLAERTSNKPLFGLVRRHRKGDPKIQRELDMALAHHAREGNEKGLMLCLWAGANPHASVPDIRWPIDDDDEEEDEGRSAVWEACAAGHASMLERLGPDPAQDDFEDLYRWAGSGAVIDLLSRTLLPEETGQVVMWHLPRVPLHWGLYGGWSSLETLERLFEVGARWKAGSKEEIADMRRSILKLPERIFVDLMKLLAKDDHCSPEVLHELARTAAFRRKMREAGFIPRQDEEAWNWERRRPTRAREVVAKCGLEKSKGERSKGKRGGGKAPRSRAPLPSRVRIGRHWSGGREIRLTRTELFDRVWSTPISQLADRWGLSDQGLAKACRRLKIPRPPRGFWARKRAGRGDRRPRLPKLPDGEAEEVVIRLPPRTDPHTVRPSSSPR